MEAGEGGANEGDKEGEKRGGNEAHRSRRERVFQGRKEAILPLLGGGQEGEKRGQRGKKNVSR